MRQNNQNKRMRGRSRKPSNPLSRTYESNGPDVKIRGTAMHVAEKYVQLARDSQASGDRIIAENYLQHAEHYFRIIAAAQGQNAVPQRDDDRTDDMASDDETQAQTQAPRSGSQQGRSRAPVIAPDAPQPFVDGMPGIEAKGANGSSRRGRNGAKPAEVDEAEGVPENGANGKDVAAEPSEAPAEVPAEVSVEADEDESGKPKRRARGSRGRGSRTKPVRGEGDDESASGEDVAEAAEAAEAAPARARRSRKSSASDEAAPASGEAATSDA
ncbi:MAG: DUF4167 domain-containing protein [Hyphomicrobiales bacterium]|nr:MAG: DUF4167 domain-containing protein [Hyphomicrobiales bacterium]